MGVTMRANWMGVWILKIIFLSPSKIVITFVSKIFSTEFSGRVFQYRFLTPLKSLRATITSRFSVNARVSQWPFQGPVTNLYNERHSRTRPNQTGVWRSRAFRRT